MNHITQPSSNRAYSLARIITFAMMVIVPITLVLSAGFLVLGIKFEYYLHRPFIWVMSGLFALMAFFWRLCIQDLD
ncbi:hypothetical protein BKI52_24380 [marine bacterium AO1-C]|nr:hypothetical protein BKI52_24380 [marine bacterium AO1-C]